MSEDLNSNYTSPPNHIGLYGGTMGIYIHSQDHPFSLVVLLRTESTVALVECELARAS